MFETIATLLLVAAAGVLFFRWFRSAAGGKGCSCGHCGKTDCLKDFKKFCDYWI